MGNTEGRLVKNLSGLTKEETDILVGSLLGDGCLRIMSKATVPAFSVSHSESQKKYVFWKYDKLKRFVQTPPWREERIYHRDRSRKTYSWRFQTLSNVIFLDLWRTFYKNGTKVIPDNIASLLRDAPLALAVWLMDDGNRNHDAVFLNTQSFSLEDQQKLSRALTDVFGFETTINKHSVSNGEQLYRVRINTESTKRLPELVKNYFLPELRYKIPHFSP